MFVPGRDDKASQRRRYLFRSGTIRTRAETSGARRHFFPERTILRGICSPGSMSPTSRGSAGPGSLPARDDIDHSTDHRRVPPSRGGRYLKSLLALNAWGERYRGHLPAQASRRGRYRAHKGGRLSDAGARSRRISSSPGKVPSLPGRIPKASGQARVPAWRRGGGQAGSRPSRFPSGWLVRSMTPGVRGGGRPRSRSAMVG